MKTPLVKTFVTKTKEGHLEAEIQISSYLQTKNKELSLNGRLLPLNLRKNGSIYYISPEERGDFNYFYFSIKKDKNKTYAIRSNSLIKFWEQLPHDTTVFPAQGFKRDILPFDLPVEPLTEFQLSLSVLPELQRKKELLSRRDVISEFNKVEHNFGVGTKEKLNLLDEQFEISPKVFKSVKKINPNSEIEDFKEDRGIEVDSTVASESQRNLLESLSTSERARYIALPSNTASDSSSNKTEIQSLRDSLARRDASIAKKEEEFRLNLEKKEKENEGLRSDLENKDKKIESLMDELKRKHKEFTLNVEKKEMMTEELEDSSDNKIAAQLKVIAQKEVRQQNQDKRQYENFDPILDLNPVLKKRKIVPLESEEKVTLNFDSSNRAIEKLKLPVPSFPLKENVHEKMLNIYKDNLGESKKMSEEEHHEKENGQYKNQVIKGAEVFQDEDVWERAMFSYSFDQSFGPHVMEGWMAHKLSSADQKVQEEVGVLFDILNSNSISVNSDFYSEFYSKRYIACPVNLRDSIDDHWILVVVHNTSHSLEWDNHASVDGYYLGSRPLKPYHQVVREIVAYLATCVCKYESLPRGIEKEGIIYFQKIVEPLQLQKCFSTTRYDEMSAHPGLSMLYLFNHFLKGPPDEFLKRLRAQQLSFEPSDLPQICKSIGDWLQHLGHFYRHTSCIDINSIELDSSQSLSLNKERICSIQGQRSYQGHPQNFSQNQTHNYSKQNRNHQPPKNQHNRSTNYFNKFNRPNWYSERCHHDFLKKYEIRSNKNNKIG